MAPAKGLETLLEIPKFHPYSKMLEQASLAIVVCGDLNLEEGTGFGFRTAPLRLKTYSLQRKLLDWVLFGWVFIRLNLL